MKFKKSGKHNFSSVAFQYKAKHLSGNSYVALSGPIFVNSSKKLRKKVGVFWVLPILAILVKKGKISKKSRISKFFS